MTDKTESLLRTLPHIGQIVCSFGSLSKTGNLNNEYNNKKSLQLLTIFFQKKIHKNYQAKLIILWIHMCISMVYLYVLVSKYIYGIHLIPRLALCVLVWIRSQVRKLMSITPLNLIRWIIDYWHCYWSYLRINWFKNEWNGYRLMVTDFSK